MATSNEMVIMRMMAWERAKGELMAFLQTFWIENGKSGGEIDNGFEKARTAIKEMIEIIDSEVL